MNKASCKELKKETGGKMVMMQRSCKSLNSGIIFVLRLVGPIGDVVRTRGLEGGGVESELLKMGIEGRVL